MAGSNTEEATERVSVLKDEIETLDKHEKMIDQHKQARNFPFWNLTTCWFPHFKD